MPNPMHEPQALPEPSEPFEPVADAEELARDLVRGRTMEPDSAIGADILRRFDTSGAPGLHAADLSSRFAPRSLRMPPVAMVVSPYAPPQRQLSVVRQGAPMWRGPAAEPPRSVKQPEQPAQPASAPPSDPPPRVAAKDPEELPSDLKALLAMHRAKGNI